jgi:two-component system response regulator HydG
MNINKAINFLNERPWLIVVINVLLVAAILLAGYQSLKATEHATFKEFNQRQLVMAKGAVGGIELYFRNLAEAMHAMARMEGVLRFDEITSRHVLALEIHELERLGVKDIGVLDANGVLRFSANAPHSEGADFSHRGYYLEAKEMTSSENYIIRFIHTEPVDTDQAGMVVAVPMFGPRPDKSHPSLFGRFAGVTFCSLDLDYLIDKLVAPVKSTGGGHAFLIDDTSKVLWDPDSSLFRKNLLQEAEGFPSFQQILQKMTAGGTGTAEYSYYRFDYSTGQYSTDKEERLMAYMPVRLGPQLWALGVWAPKKDATRSIRSAYIKHLLLVAVVVISIFFGCFYGLAMSLRYNKTLEAQVEVKTRDFQESHLRLLTVLDSLDAAVYVADMETHEILYGNKYVRDIFGQVDGKICWQVMQDGQSGPCDFCTKERLLTPDGEPAGVSVREFQKEVTGKWYEVRDRAIRWVDGRTAVLQIAADVTDRKQTEEDLERAHSEMDTFCNMLKQIGSYRTLSGVGSLLMKAVQNIVGSQYTLLHIFNSERNMLFTLMEAGTSTNEDPELIRTAQTVLKDLDGMTIAPKNKFNPPLIPDYFPAARQTIIPLRIRDQLEGAFVITCESDCLCDEKALEMVSLVLEYASETIKKAVAYEEEIRDLEKRVESTAEFSGLIGKDPKMQVIYKLIEDIAPTDATVLIEGESGTGKELVARAIHRRSPRHNKPFIVINCSAYPTTLLESELFGHEKGAFTGAIRHKIGRFEQAHGGTVFLDEIGEIAPSAQIKLLRVIQSQRFERLGGEKTLSVDVHILAATNKDLLQEVKNGNFREDLYYRLNVIPIHLPALRERRNDIPLLARHFLSRFIKEQDKEIQGFTTEAMRLLLDYDWPGNVRELENSIEHATVLAKGDRVEASDLPAIVQTQGGRTLAERLPTIEEQEKNLLLETLEKCGWVKKEAAQHLGISRTALYDKLKRYQISKPTTH